MPSQPSEPGPAKKFPTQPGHAHANPPKEPVLNVELTPGSLVGGYRIERKLAEGGMGTVYIARHVVLPRRAALKILRPELTDTPLARDSLLQEGRILETLLDPRIARVYDAGFLEAGRPWIAMELLDGECLADLVVRKQRLTISEVAHIVSAIVDALSAAHVRGVVHSDVKPENIIVQEGPHGTKVKMIDWGIARIAAHTKVEPFAVGTPHYMAPEQVRGEAIDPRADIYALGVLAYELLSGRTPFNGDTPADIAIHHLRTQPQSLRVLRRDVPPAIESLVNAMLAKEASARPTLETVRACFSLVSDAQLMALDEAPEVVASLGVEQTVTRPMAVVDGVVVPVPAPAVAPAADASQSAEMATVTPAADAAMGGELDVPSPDGDLEIEVEVSIEDDAEAGADVVHDSTTHPRWTPPHGRPTNEPLSMRETLRFARAITSGGASKHAVAGMIRKAG